MMQQIIIDTDIGCDCDDAGALAVAHALQHQGKCVLGAMTHCTSRIDGYSTIEVINRYYGCPDIPIGIYRPDGFLDEPDRKCYSRYIQQHYGNRFQKKADCPDAIAVLRKAIAESEKGRVSVVGIGPMMNLAGLLDSPGDAISPLTGSDLIREKECPLFCMAACFDQALYPYLDQCAEWNVKQAVPEASHVFETWPTEVFVIPFETGYDILTGGSLLESPVNNPVRVSYEQYGEIMRSSWDPCTVHFAVTRSTEYWKTSEPGFVTILENGISLFKPNPDGRHRLVYVRDKGAAASCLEQLIGWIPQQVLQPSKIVV